MEIEEPAPADNAKLLKKGRRLVPGLGLFYFQWALDTAILNGLFELLAPGYQDQLMQDQERRREAFSQQPLGEEL